MFEPPRCPWTGCRHHTAPVSSFCTRHGSYRAKCRPRPIPRFRCSACKRTFSRQTFRADYYDHKPHLNAWLFELLNSGVGLRQSARLLHLSRRCLELKARKIARHLTHLNANLRGPLPEGSTMHLDELETFEGARGTRPLSVPNLIETESRFMIWSESAPIAPKGRMSEKRREAIQADEERYGLRIDRSREALEHTLAHGAELAKDLKQVVLYTDEKSSYPGLARRAFGADRLVHHQTNSRLDRTVNNPLFPINHAEAIERDLMGRLRRESWLVSKESRYLDGALQVFMAYRNYVRRRFNSDEESAASHLGFVARRMTSGEVLSWRQDWGHESPHPLSRAAMSVQSVGTAAKAV